jgi:hypothetical protein
MEEAISHVVEHVHEAEAQAAAQQVKLANEGLPDTGIAPVMPLGAGQARTVPVPLAFPKRRQLQMVVTHEEHDTLKDKHGFSFRGFRNDKQTLLLYCVSGHILNRVLTQFDSLVSSHLAIPPVFQTKTHQGSRMHNTPLLHLKPEIIGLQLTYTTSHAYGSLLTNYQDNIQVSPYMEYVTISGTTFQDVAQGLARRMLLNWYNHGAVLSSVKCFESGDGSEANPFHLHPLGRVNDIEKMYVNLDVHINNKFKNVSPATSTLNHGGEHLQTGDHMNKNRVDTNPLIGMLYHFNQRQPVISDKWVADRFANTDQPTAQAGPISAILKIGTKKHFDLAGDGEPLNEKTQINLDAMRYGDSADNTVREEFSVLPDGRVIFKNLARKSFCRIAPGDVLQFGHTQRYNMPLNTFMHAVIPIDGSGPGVQMLGGEAGSSFILALKHEFRRVWTAGQEPTIADDPQEVILEAVRTYRYTCHMSGITKAHMANLSKKGTCGEEQFPYREGGQSGQQVAP